MASIHISQAEAERDLHSLLVRVSEDTSFVIENGSHPVAVLQAAPKQPLTLEERIALLPSEGSPVMDESFARDVEFAINRYRTPLDSSIWD